MYIYIYIYIDTHTYRQHSHAYVIYILIYICNIHIYLQYTTKELMSLIQASKVELMEGLKNLGALDIDGYWRVLDSNFQEKAFSQILALMEENSWGTDSIPLEDTCQVLQELYPRSANTYCYSAFFAFLVHVMP